MKKLLSALLFLASFQVLAADPQIGREFDKTLQIIPTDNPSKIEVTEVFWYGCIHCYQMDPLLNDWVKNYLRTSRLDACLVYPNLLGRLWQKPFMPWKT